MPDPIFLTLSLIGLVAGFEQNVDVLYYAVGAGASWSIPPQNDLNAFLTQWLTDNQLAWLDTKPTDYVLLAAVAKGYDAAGVPLAIAPVVRAVNVAGNAPATRDTNGVTITTVPVMGNAVVLGANPTDFLRSYLAIGPMASANVGDNGDFLAAGSASFLALIAALAADVLVPASHTWNPARFSFISGIARVPQIIQYRFVSDWFYRQFCSFRRSRLNRR